MIVIDNLMQVANQIETERGVTKEILFSAIEQAIISACHKKISEETEVEAVLSPLEGKIEVNLLKTVVKEIEDEDLEISLEDANKLNSSYKVGEQIRIPYNEPDFGRLAAQTARQVIVQRIREAEKESVYDDFKDKVETIITGVVQRIENNNYLINLGRTEAILSYREQIPGERFMVKEKIRVFLANVEKGTRGNNLYISRAHPGMLKCLFALEIPEIQDGIIEVKAVSREPGKRAKVAVKSNNPTVGAVGTCVGQMGARIQAIIKEIGAEKIDVLEWDEEPKKFISNALKPAKISLVTIKSEEDREALVVVPNDQLSLAIGKQGINVRLSVKLTGWKLDIINEEEYSNRIDSGEGTGENLSLEEKMQLEKEKQEQQSESPSFVEEEEDFGESSLANKLKAAMEERHQSASEVEEDVIMKVSDLAKMLGMKTAELMEQSEKIGVQIPSNRAKLNADQVQSIKEGIKNS